jgi:hypothetical protein
LKSLSAAKTTESAKATVAAEEDKPTFTRRLDANPFFREGAALDEFQVTKENIGFAQQQFGLDQAFADLVKSADKNVRYSVVYHSDAGGLKTDAYRVAAAAGKDAVFTAYHVKNPDFNPAQAYRMEIMTKLGEGRYFGTVVASRNLAVPDCADPQLKEYLKNKGFHLEGTVPFNDFGYSKEFKDMFGIGDKLGVEMYQMDKKSFIDKFKLFYKLMKDNPEYRMLKIGDMVGDVGAALLLGIITPKLWEQGAAYGIASTITSIGNIGSPAIGILGESFLGSIVDNAVNSDRPLENLKKIGLATGGLDTVKAGAYMALHPEIIRLLGSHPGWAFVGLYGASTVAGAVSGVMAGKASFAVHDQLINKGPDSKPEYTENFFQILGMEASVSRLLYLGSYTASVAAAKAVPGASLALAAVGSALWGLSNFMFPLYHEKPEMKTTIEGSAFIHQGNRYIFDSGWEISFKGDKGKLVKEDDGHYSVSFGDGDLYIKHNGEGAVTVDHKRRLKDHLPKFLKPKFIGEKELWKLSDGHDGVSVSRYGNLPYRMDKISDTEFIITKGDGSDSFWRDDLKHPAAG